MKEYTRPCPLAQLPHAPPFHPDQLRHAQQGCPDCLDLLVRANEPLVRWTLGRMSRRPLPYEQALQAGRIALWHALLHFDPQRGVAFSSYAVVAILRRVDQERQRFQRFWRPLPDLDPDPRPDPLEQAAQSVDRQRLVQAVPAWIAHLPPRLALLVRDRYGCQGRPPQVLHTLAQAQGITYQRVQQLLREAHLRLALPLPSWEVRRLLGRTSTADVQAALRAWRRFRTLRCRQEQRRRRAR